MYVFTDSTLRYLLKKIKSKIALKSELDNKVDKVDGKDLSDNDFTDSAKSLLETKFNSVEASYSTGMTHIKFSNENESNTKTIDLKTGCDMFFYPTIDAELLADLEGNITIPYAFISKSGSDIGKVTVKIENLTNNTNSENVFNVTDNGSELILEGASSGNANVSFIIEGSTEELKANVLGEYSTVIMLPLTVYRSTDSSLVPSNVSNTKTVVSDFGNGEYEIMLYTTTSTNYLNFSNVQTLTNVSYISDSITNMAMTYYYCHNLTGLPVCGNNVTNMYHTYYKCYNLKGSPVCGPNVTDMSYTYSGCSKLIGSPACGDKATTMRSAYAGCAGLTGNPVCGPNIINMEWAYSNCLLDGAPVCGNNVTNIGCAYYNCRNLTGSPVCGDKVTGMNSTYYDCRNLTGNPVCGNNVTDMRYTYSNCKKLTGSPVCGDSVTDMSGAYHNCSSLNGSPVCGDNVINMRQTYYNCINLTGSPVCGDSVTDMRNAYYRCCNLTGSPVCGPNVTNMHCTYQECYSLTGNAACGPNVIDMSKAYFYSYVPGKAACGNNVTNMSQAYAQCVKLEGPAACGPNVNNMYQAYYNCINLKGTPVCGDKVFNMYQTYAYCSNLTGRPIVGNTVEIMTQAYYNCFNLTGDPICGKNVVAMDQAFANCYNLQGNMYLFSNFVQQANSVFNGRNTTNRLNIYYNAGANSYHTTTTHHTLRNAPLTGNTISWTDDRSVNGCYYNAKENIYLYPMVNVREIYKENELLIARYKMNSGANVIPEGTIEGVREVKIISEDVNSGNGKFELGTLGVDITSVEEITTSVGDLYLINDYTEIYGYVQYRYGAPDAPDKAKINLMVYSDTNKVHVENIFNCNEVTLYIPGPIDMTTMTTIEDAIDDNGRTIIRSVYLDESQVGKLPKVLSFNGATDLLTVEKLRTENITDGTNMFKGCSNFKGFEINEETFVPDFSNIENATSMFEGCSSLETLDMSGFNTLKTEIYSTDFTDFVVTESESKSMGQINGIEDVEIYSAGFQTKYPFIDKTVTEGVNDIYKFESSEGYFINVVVYPDGQVVVRTTADNDSEILCLRTYSVIAKDICAIEYADYMFAGCSSLTEIISYQDYSLIPEGERIEISVGTLDAADEVMAKAKFKTLDGTYTSDYSRNDNPETSGGAGWCRYTIAYGTGYINYTASFDPNTGILTIWFGSGYGTIPEENGLVHISKDFELPNVESASHIFDGCTNLL